MITFTLGVKNAPTGTVYWTAIWYEPGVGTWYSPYLAPNETATFSGVPSTAWLYVTAYDRNYNVLADYGTWGRFTFRNGGQYIANFATRAIEGIEVPQGEIITFTLGVKNVPTGTAYWSAIWYEPGIGAWYSTYLTPDKVATFSGVPSTAWLYVSAYDRNYNVIADYNTWGRFTFRNGGQYIANFATRTIEEVGAAPVIGQAEFTDLRASFNA